MTLQYRAEPGIDVPLRPIVVRLGIPTHFRPSSANVAACGLECPEFAAYDGKDVDCVSCRKTKAWKTYMGKHNTPGQALPGRSAGGQ